MNEVTIPIEASSLRADQYGFASLGRISQQICAFRSTTIRLDFSNVGWMDAHLASPLLTIIRQSQRYSNNVTMPGINDKLLAILQKNRFLAVHRPDNYNTTIPITEFDKDSPNAFAQFTKKHLDHPDMPNMTAALRSKFFEAVDELFANCALHSHSSVRICAGGQFYPHKKLLTFAITDGGHVIQGALRMARRSVPEAHEAIDWALQDGSTTRQGDNPGGLGLKVLREFLRMNGGRLIVVSNGGYWCQTRNGIHKIPLPTSFPGTSVLLDIFTADKNTYDFVGKPAPSEIW